MGKIKDKTESKPQTGLTVTGPAPVPGAEVRRPSSAMMALFAKRATEIPVMDKLKRLNVPQLVKPTDVPINGTVSGIIVDCIKSMKSTIKGSLLWLHLVSFDDKNEPIKTGIEITFPATGVIRNALAPGLDRELNEEARKVMLQYKGHLFCAQRTEDKMSTEFKKSMTTWDVRVSPKPVDIGVKIN